MSNTLNFSHIVRTGPETTRNRQAEEAARYLIVSVIMPWHPKNPEALISLGRFQLEMASPKRPATAFWFARDPHSADAFVLLAEACLAGDDADLEQAHDALRQAAELDPSSASIRAELGKVQIALGMETEGQVSLEIAVELESKNPLYLRDLIDALMDLGLEEEATRWARNAIFQNPRIQGFQTLWNDLRFCLTADELESETDLSPPVPKKPKSTFCPSSQPQNQPAASASESSGKMRASWPPARICPSSNPIAVWPDFRQTKLVMRATPSWSGDSSPLSH